MNFFFSSHELLAYNLRYFIKGKQKNEVIADIIISHFNPISGKSHAPTNVEQVPAKLEIEQNKANEVDSFPLIVERAINVIRLRKINIPNTLNMQV